MFLVSVSVNRFSISGQDFSGERGQNGNIEPKLIGDDTNSEKLLIFNMEIIFYLKLKIIF
jgi:hypothetical protein